MSQYEHFALGFQSFSLLVGLAGLTVAYMNLRANRKTEQHAQEFKDKLKDEENEK